MMRVVEFEPIMLAGWHEWLSVHALVARHEVSVSATDGALCICSRQPNATFSTQSSVVSCFEEPVNDLNLFPGSPST